MQSDGEKTDPESLANDLESEAGTLQDRSDDLGNEISNVKEDWRRKQQDSGTPGAEPAGDPFAEGADSAPTGGEEGEQGEG